MTTMPPAITGGVDTHLDVHVAAALGPTGALLGVESFETTPAGYAELLDWLSSFGERRAGRRGRHRQLRRRTHPPSPRRGRAASSRSTARTVRSAAGAARATPKTRSPRPAPRSPATPHGEAKTRDGNVESMRVLRVARSSARKARTQCLNQMRSIISTAPEPIRAELRHLNVYRLLERASAYRPGQRRDVTSLTKVSLRMLARRAARARGRDRRARRHPRTTRPRHRPEADRPARDRRRQRLRAARRRRRQPRTAPQRSHLRSPLRRRAPRRQQRQTRTPPTQPRRRPPSQLGALAHRRSPAWSTTHAPATTSTAAPRKASPRKKPSAASSATSPARSTTRYPEPNSPLTTLGASVGGTQRLGRGCSPFGHLFQVVSRSSDNEDLRVGSGCWTLGTSTRGLERK